MLGILLGLWISGCVVLFLNIFFESENKFLVVFISMIIVDMIEKIGGDEIEYQGIIKLGVDFYIYEFVFIDSVVFEKVDLIIYNGYNLEFVLIKFMNVVGIKV